MSEFDGLSTDFRVAPAKLTEYLLNPGHPAGGPKAAFFVRFGFSRAGWRLLELALLAHALRRPASRIVVTGTGFKFIYEGPLASPDGRNPNVRTIWQIDHGDTQARFITAKPLTR